MTDAQINSLTRRIIGCAVEVHRRMGPGLIESVYRECFMLELRLAGLGAAAERCVRLAYRDAVINSHLRLDLLVEETVVVEMKSVDALHPVHVSQVLSYLKLTGCPAGLLINFNVALLKTGIRRIDHPDRFVRKKGRIC